MRINRELFGRPGLQWLAFGLGLALFMWPYFSDRDWPSEFAYVYFFSCWAALVLFLAWSARARASAPRRDRPEKGSRA